MTGAATQGKLDHGIFMLGHELSHVVPQRQGRVRNPLGAGLAVVQDRTLETERLGRRAAQPQPAKGARRAIQRMQAGPTRYNYTDVNLPAIVPQGGIIITDFFGEDITVGWGFFKSRGSNNYIVYSKRDGGHWSIAKRAQAAPSHSTSASTAERRGAENRQLTRNVNSWKSWQNKQSGVRKT